MKKYRLSSVLFVLLVITFLFGVLTVEGLGNPITLDFTFEKDILYSEANPVYDSNFNLRNQTVFTDNYTGTYSFEGEIGLEGLDIPFIDYISLNPTNTFISISPSFNGHNAILNLSDNTLTAYLDFYSSFSIQTNSIIEFWFLTTNITSTSGFTFRFYEASSIKIDMTINVDDLTTSSPGGILKSNCLIANQWNHVKFVLDDTANIFDFYFNNILEKDDLAYVNPSTIGINKFQFGSGTNDIIDVYIDAIGYYWDKTNYTGTNFDLSGGGTEPTGMTWDGTNYWICFTTNSEVYQYTSAGVYTGTHFDTSGQDIYPMGITWDSTYFYVVGSNTDEVYQYTSAGVYTGTHFDVGTEDTHPTGINWDGTHFWVVGKDTDKVYQYTSAGVYTGFFFSISSQDNNPSDIAFDGEYLWVLGYQNQEVYQYTSVGVYTGTHFDVNTEDYATEGLLFKDGFFWTTGLQHVKAYKYRYIEVPYNIGDNMIPVIETNELIQEFDRYEFMFEGTNDLFDVGDDNPNGWSDIEGGGGDEVNCMGNGIVNISNSGDYDPGTGLQLTGRYITGERINVSFGFELIDLTSIISSDLGIYLDSSDNTEVIRINIDEDGDLDYYNSGDAKVNLNHDMIEGIYYEFNFFIHYEINLCVLRYSADNVFIDSYMFPLKVSGKEGLRDIVFEVEADTSGHQVDLDYVGIYKNGLAMAEGWGYLTYNLDADWDFEKRNLFMIDAKGLFSIQAIEGDYEHEEAMDEIIDYDSFDGSRTLNLYDIGADYTDCTLVFFFLSFWVVDAFYRAYIYDFADLNIEGVNITEGVNSYDLIYTHGSIDVDESYFYVDSSNRLQFNLIANNDNLEYIQAVFDIQNIATENRSIRFYSNIDGNSKGYFALDYESATSSTIEFPYSAKSTNIILTQTEFIESFTILITDNNLDNDDACEGYITGIKLIYYPDLATTITSLNLLSIIVPLIILIAPPMALQKKFGSKIILPMFILMAIVCVVTKLIPVWLFFIIAFASIGFIVLKEKVGVEM